MTKALCGAAVAALLVAAPAFADPATSAGAKAILERYAAIIGQEAIDKGLVSVKPDGEAYLVTWTFGAILAKPEKPNDPNVAIAPFTYRETPKGDGALSGTRTRCRKFRSPTPPTRPARCALRRKMP